MNALNLCEILNEQLIDDGIVQSVLDELMKTNPIERIYIGSYFCSQYFLHMNFADKIMKICVERKLKITLVIPVFSQKDMAKGKDTIQKILYPLYLLIDEITVNDCGMLDYISKHYDELSLNLGRLFFKDTRDLRMREYTESEVVLSSFDTAQILADTYSVRCAEIDQTARKMVIPKDCLNLFDVCVHTPFCYMSTGNICKYASIHQPCEQKFRPNLPCQTECQKIYEHTRQALKGYEFDMYRIGRTIYCRTDKKSELNRETAREIYFPAEEVYRLIMREQL